ncbi:Olfactory receptor 8U9, partial [Aptenodytes forsteri]
FPATVVSHACIVSTIPRIHVADSRRKACYTCTSHLAAVGLFYSSLLFTYLWPSSSYSLDADKVISAFYTVVFPVLNPLIDSLRNKLVK